MALTDKNLIITPNIGSTSDPKVDFIAASASTGPSTITATIYPTNNGTLSFDGTEGSLFSISNNLSTGSIFSVNPISGIPIIDVNADRTIALNPYGGNTGIGITNPTAKLHVVGNALITGTSTFSGIATYTSTLFSSQLSVSGLTTSSRITLNGANDTATGGGQIYLNGATGNRIDFNANGFAAPTFNTLSVGTKIVLYPDLSASTVGYAFGMESGGSWQSITGVGAQHRWYAGTTSIATLNGSGTFSVVGQLISTRANSTTTGGGQIYLNGATGNRIDFAAGGYATPATTTRSVGTKIVLDPGVTVSTVDYALGIENTALWSSIPSSVSQFKWYASTTNIATLFGTGQLVIGTTGLTGTASQNLQVTGGAYVSGNLGVGVTNPSYPLHVNGTIKGNNFFGAAGNTGATALTHVTDTTSSSVSLWGKDDTSWPGHTHIVANSSNASASSGQVVIWRYDGSNFLRTATFDKSGNFLINRTTPTGSAGQALQVDSGAYIASNVGIAVTNPLYRLDVSGIARINATGTEQLTVQGSGGGYFFAGYDNANSRARIGSFSTGTGWTNLLLNEGGGNVIIGSTSATGTSSQALQVNSGAYVSGNMGIGAVSPLTKLDSRGTILIATNSNGNNLLAFGNTTGFGPLSGAPDGSHGNSFIIGNSSGASGAPSYLSFWTTSGGVVGERLRLDSSGNLGIGITNPTQKLQVVGNTLITGQFQSTQGNSTADGGGQIYLNGATGNRIDFNANGVTGPAFTTRSVGTKIVLYPNISGVTVDYALGIEGNTLWYSIPSANSSSQHRWYAGTTQLADLKGSGELVIGSTSLTGTTTQRLQVTGGAYVSGNLGVGVTNPSWALDVNGIGRFTNSFADVRLLNNYSASAQGYRFALDGLSPNNLYLQRTTNNFSTASNILVVDSSGNLLINNTSATGTASQRLQVTGGAYVSGNLGVGVTNPAEKLEVAGNFKVILDTVQSPAKNVARIVDLGYQGITGAKNWALRGVYQYSGGVNTNADGGDLDLIKSFGGHTVLATKTDGTALGNVGIGVLSPTAYRLQVSGDIKSTQALHFGSGGTYEAGTLYSDGNWGLIIRALQASPVTADFLFTNSADVYRLKIDPSGNVIIPGGNNATGTASQLLQVFSGAYIAGNVGVGITNPGAKLDIFNGSSADATPELRISGTGWIDFHNKANAGNYNSLVQANDKSIIFTDGTPGTGNLVIGPWSSIAAGLRITGAGNVGFGVANPASNTQVAIAGTFGISEVGGLGTRTLFTSTSAGFVLNHTDNSPITFQTLGTNRLTYSHASNFWSIPSGIPLLVGTGTSTGTASQPLQVTGGAYVSGNLGVGVANPSDKLHTLGGNIRIDSATGVLTFWSGAGFYGGIGVAGGLGGSGTDIVVRSDAGRSIIFYTGGANDRGRIDSNGNIGISTNNPLQKLDVRGNFLLAADATTANHITQKPYTTNNGTLSWEGSAGQLFSITNNLTSGSIFSVNDVSGIPSIDVDANGTIELAPFGGNIGVGTVTPTTKVDVFGNVKINSNVGANGSTALTSMDGRLIFDTDYSDIARGPNKIELLNNGVGFVAGFGVHTSTVSYYSGEAHKWYRSTSQTAFTEVMTLSNAGALVTASTIDAPSFRDSANTAYYLDPANTTTSLNVAGSITLGAASSGATATPAKLDTGNTVSNGTTRDKCKIYLYNSGTEQYGFSVGNSGDVQYHSNITHDFYIGNTKIATINNSSLALTGQLTINNSAPTLYLQDTDGNSASVHTNSNFWYVLRGGNNTTSMTQVDAVWPLAINLTNNDATFGRSVYSLSYQNILHFNASWRNDGVTALANSFNYIMGASNDTGSKMVMFVNSSTRTTDGGASGLTFRNDGGPLNLGSASYTTNIVGSSITGNVSIDAPSFRDSANTAFYLDPANTGTSLNVAGVIIGAGNVSAWNTTTPGTGVGGLHLGAASGTGNAGPAITFGARDASSGGNAQAGIYINSDGTYGTRMYFATSDNYATGSKVAMSIDQAGAVSITRSNLNISGDGSTLYGPNSGWSQYLRVGGNGNADTTNASVVTTNGNLHLDAKNGAFATYLNFYKGTNGVIFGNGAQGSVATVDSSGNSSFRTITSTIATASGAPFIVSSTTKVTNLNADLFDDVDSVTRSASHRANRNLTGGGTITVDASYNVLWSTRFIIISNGTGSNFATSGYFDITCPTTGTITGAGGAGNVTATANGIPLGAWQAIYYILPIGSANTSLAANFRIASYLSAVDIPHNWVLICIRNGDDNVVTFNNGITLTAGQSIPSIKQSITANNTLVKRDASGNFTAGTITATGSVNVTGNVAVDGAFRAESSDSTQRFDIYYNETTDSLDFDYLTA